MEAEQKVKDEKSQLITRDTLIADIVHKYPAGIDVLMEEGVSCVGCGASLYESVEQGLKGHGMPDSEVDRVLKRLNEVAEEEDDFKDDLRVTDRAIAKIQELGKKEGHEDIGLRIQITAGGCAGFQYALNFEEKEKEGDIVKAFKDLKIYVDDETMELLKGARIDYIDSLQGSGFKITNPNAKSTCGCGDSFH